MNPDKKLTRILCIDGGGVRGLIPAYFLSELEERFGIETFSAFDIIAGTSTGGILALCLTAPDISGKQAKFTARECLELYEKNSDAIFPKIRRFTRKIPPFKMFNVKGMTIFQKILLELHLRLQHFSLQPQSQISTSPKLSNLLMVG